MELRHVSFRNEVVSTQFGLLALDHNGFVVNRADLKCSDDALLSLPSLVSNEDFPLANLEELPSGVVPVQIPVQPPLEAASEAPAPEAPDSVPGADQTEELGVVALLLTEPENMNSQGKLDMDKLNAALAAKGLPKANGRTRDALVTLVQSQ